ncbi:MAG: serine protease [Proteobacteria bacterium]|nr:serine protease [Pseudomonadota bacterium]
MSRFVKDLFLLALAALLAAGTAAAAGPAAATAMAEAKTSRTSFFNNLWLKSVVSMEVRVPGGEPQPLGTGFLVKSPGDHILLVTARHVIVDSSPRPPCPQDPQAAPGQPSARVREGLAYRLNDAADESLLLLDADLQKSGLGPWFLDPGNDLACRFIVRRESSDIALIPLEAFLSWKDVEAGTPLMVLGFPLGLRSTEHARPIARRGMVARSDADGIIADAMVFPGSSGGPVLYAPYVKMGAGLTSPVVNEEKLVGLVFGFIPYEEAAVSVQTRRPRIIFEENSGLARLVSADAIRDLIASPDVKNQESRIR